MEKDIFVGRDDFFIYGYNFKNADNSTVSKMTVQEVTFSKDISDDIFQLPPGSQKIICKTVDEHTKLMAADIQDRLPDLKQSYLNYYTKRKSYKFVYFTVLSFVAFSSVILGWVLFRKAK